MLRAWWLGIVAAEMVLSCGGERGLGAGSAVPRTLVDVGAFDRPSDPATTYVLWVVDASTCLGCQTPDYLLRRVLARDSTQLRVLHVGDAGDVVVVRTFLGDRRLPMPIATVTPSRARRLFGDRPIPFLVVARRDTILWVGLVADLNQALGGVIAR